MKTIVLVIGITRTEQRRTTTRRGTDAGFDGDKERVVRGKEHETQNKQNAHASPNPVRSGPCVLSAVDRATKVISRSIRPAVDPLIC
jgi:hypothetical protein